MSRAVITFSRKFLGIAIASFLMAGTMCRLAQGQALVKQTYATAPDGVRIAIQESGNPHGPEILFIHGLLGSHLDWFQQISNPAMQRFRLITYDLLLRGHGLSDKPSQANFYTDCIVCVRATPWLTDLGSRG
jgi:alpha-beta hydrolase superfamily lysophospholipase